jgi:hypothetical protein
MLLNPSIGWSQLVPNQLDLSAASGTLHDGSLFGLTLAVNASSVAVSAPYEAVNGVEAAGVVYVYNNDGTLWFRVENPNPTPHSYFGNGLAINDDMLVIGASHASHSFPFSGVVYIYDSAGAAMGEPIPNPGSKTIFGREIEIAQDGAIYISAVGGTGEVYRYSDASGGMGTATVNGLSFMPFANPDSVVFPIYGNSISVNPEGDLFVSGQKFFATGAVIHRFDSAASLQSSVPVDDVIGLVLEADGSDMLYVGAVKSGSLGLFGSLHVYDNTGQLQMVIDGSEVNDGFAASLAIMQDFMLVGAPASVINGVAGAGNVHVYDRATGGLLETLVWPTSASAPGAARFGHRIAARGNKLVIAAPFADTAQGEDAGEVFTFSAEPARFCGRLLEDFDRVFIGTEGDDVIIGTSKDDLIILLGGNDLGRGRKGRDCVMGGPGRDLLRGGRGKDELAGGEGSDTCRGGEVLVSCEG